jgi:hypothetical protein
MINMRSYGLIIPSPLNQSHQLCGYINQVTHIFNNFIIAIGLQITPKIATSQVLAKTATKSFHRHEERAMGRGGECARGASTAAEELDAAAIEEQDRTLAAFRFCVASFGEEQRHRRPVREHSRQGVSQWQMWVNSSEIY